MQYSMISLGAVLLIDGVVDDSSYYYDAMCPIYPTYEQAAYDVNGFTHEEAETFDHPGLVMPVFLDWLNERKVDGERLHFVSDNAGFDWQFVNSYLWFFCGENPFGHSPMSLTWYFKGKKGIKSSFQSYRKKVSPVPHTHNALTDALGNAITLQALLKE